MEKLILRAGRYIPRPEASDSDRIHRLEDYLATLTEELERLVAEVDRALDALEASIGASQAAGEEGSA